MSQYATAADLAAVGLPATALAGINSDPFLVRASGLIDSHLRGNYGLPLKPPFPDEIIEATVRIAAYRLLVFRGFRPDQYDENFMKLHDDTIAWLRDVAASRVHLDIAADQTTTFEGAPRVQTDAQRGWFAAEEA